MPHLADTAAAGTGPSPYSISDFVVGPDDDPEYDDDRSATIEAKRPKKTAWVRACTDPAFTLDVWTAEIDVDGKDELFLVRSNLLKYFDSDERRKRRYILAQTRAGEQFLWEIKLAMDGYDEHTATTTSLYAAAVARDEWVRVFYSKAENKYVIRRQGAAAIAISEPKWDLARPIGELVIEAFGARVLATEDNPVLQSHLHG